MSTFLAHGIAGWTAFEVAHRLRPDDWQSRRWPAVFAALSILPDMDAASCALFGTQNMAFLEIGDGHDPHRGVTHALLFAVIAGGVASLFGAWNHSRERWLRRWAWMSCAVALHPLLDYFTANGAGMPLLFPFSRERFLSPWDLLPIPGYSLSVRTFAAVLFEQRTWECFAWETTIFVPLLLAARFARARASGESAREFVARPLQITLFAALSIAACFHVHHLWFYWAHLSQYPIQPTAGESIARALFGLVQVTLPIALLIRAWRATHVAQAAAPSKFFPLATLLAISSSAIFLRGLLALTRSMR